MYISSQGEVRIMPDEDHRGKDKCVKLKSVTFGSMSRETYGPRNLDRLGNGINRSVPNHFCLIAESQKGWNCSHLFCRR